MNAKRELLLPVVTGIVAIILERALYNHSRTWRSLAGADDAR
jgi:hypothetical protein